MALRLADIASRITFSTHATTPSGRTKLHRMASKSVRLLGDGQKRRVIRVTDPVHRLIGTKNEVPLQLLCSHEVEVKERKWVGGNRDEKEDSKRKYCVNLGYAIRTLREEAPGMFHREPSFDIYRDDIVFKDPVNTFSGIENYKIILWALRLNTRIFFKTVWVDILRVWQPVEDVIMIRWTVHGIPRVAWEESSHGRFEGTSEYKLDKHGKIYEHRVDNVAMNPPPKFHSLHLSQLILLSFGIGCSPSSPPKPICFKKLAEPGRQV